MNEVEKKLYDYAQSVEWDFDKMDYKLKNLHRGCIDDYKNMTGGNMNDKITLFIEKYKPEVQSITLPIEVYDRLRKLEIKAEIKKLKRELKRL